jgi:hypothetical protein
MLVLDDFEMLITHRSVRLCVISVNSSIVTAKSSSFKTLLSLASQTVINETRYTLDPPPDSQAAKASKAFDEAFNLTEGQADFVVLIELADGQNGAVFDTVNGVDQLKL